MGLSSRGTLHFVDRKFPRNNDLLITVKIKNVRPERWELKSEDLTVEVDRLQAPFKFKRTFDRHDLFISADVRAGESAVISADAVDDRNENIHAGMNERYPLSANAVEDINKGLFVRFLISDDRITDDHAQCLWPWFIHE
jgi:hypothetical protein